MPIKKQKQKKKLKLNYFLIYSSTFILHNKLKNKTSRFY